MFDPVRIEHHSQCAICNLSDRSRRFLLEIGTRGAIDIIGCVLTERHKPLMGSTWIRELGYLMSQHSKGRRDCQMATALVDLLNVHDGAQRFAKTSRCTLPAADDVDCVSRRPRT
jgi:hypothetical protein